MDPPANIQLRIVLDHPIAAYSGMVPGFVAGDYDLDELEIDVLPLARRARASVILAAARSIDPLRREITIEGRPPIRYDLASIDVGSSVRGLDLPGVSKHTLATRPIGPFVRAIDAKLQTSTKRGGPLRILVVGGGAAGTELAFTVDARLRRSGHQLSLAIVTADQTLLPDMNARTQRAIQSEAENRGIESVFAKRVLRADSAGLVIGPATANADEASETRLAADLVIWATGAAPIAFPEDSHETTSPRLSRDGEGFLEIRDTLQTLDFDDLFAVGDCARLVNHRWVPRAGVYAVRQGPVLEQNLRAMLAGQKLRRIRPQRDFLSLLYLGSGRAIASKWGFSVTGQSIFRLKNRIDRHFMRRFQVLDASGVPRPELENLGTMTSKPAVGDDTIEMSCGGCAAKLGAEPLGAALARLPTARPDASVLLGLDARDDVAVTSDESGRTTLHNIDVIRSFCDDPWLVGQVAATNALSDLFAKGGRPRYAQAVVGLPETLADEAEELLFQVLSGVRASLDDEGVSLLGGHTTIGSELTVGLSVSGDGPASGSMLRQTGSEAGDDLVYAGLLGTGVILAADQQGLAKSRWVSACYQSMQASNALAGRLAIEFGVHAATDVTGFGLAGHLINLLARTNLRAQLERSSIPLLPGAGQLWAMGHRSTAHPVNRAAFLSRVGDAGEADEAWLFDPQTAGGLLFAVPKEQTRALIDAFAAAGESRPSKIGRLISGELRRNDSRGFRIELLDSL
jgi:selenide,water dikinase